MKFVALRVSSLAELTLLLGAIGALLLDIYLVGYDFCLVSEFVGGIRLCLASSRSVVSPCGVSRDIRCLEHKVRVFALLECRVVCILASFWQWREIF